MNMEFNKVFAAILTAGIVASLSGFISDKVMPEHELKENAYKIEGVAADTGAGGAAAEARPEPILAMLATADAGKGQEIAKVCQTCHNLTKGGPNAIGPNLYGVVGRPKGSHEGFAYSDAMKAKGGNWTLADLNKFLWKPKAFVDGTKMTFVGLKKPEDRANVIAYLRTLSDSPVALPGAKDIAAEQAELAPAAASGAAAPTAKPGAPAGKDAKAPAKTDAKAAAAPAKQ